MSHKCNECIHCEVCIHKDKISFFKELHEKVEADVNGFPLFKTSVFCTYYNPTVQVRQDEEYFNHLVEEFENTQAEREVW